MKTIIKLFILIIIFIGSILVFFPKENLYYYGVEKLHKEQIDIETTDIKDNYDGLYLQNTRVLYGGIKALNIQSIDIKTYIYQSSIILKDITINDNFKQFLPSKINYLIFKHTILKPNIIDININSNQIKAYGYIDINKMKLYLYLKPSKYFLKSYKQLLIFMKKEKNGEYKVEYKL